MENLIQNKFIISFTKKFDSRFSFNKKQIIFLKVPNKSRLTTELIFNKAGPVIQLQPASCLRRKKVRKP